VSMTLIAFRTLAKPGDFSGSLFILPMFAILQIIIGSIMGRFVMALMRIDPKSADGREVAMCSSFGNSGKSRWAQGSRLDWRPF
jgi:predicted permease